MYVVYMYDANNNPLTQFFNISEFQINKKLNDISTASFSISTSEDLSLIQILNKIKITDYLNEDKIYFEGVIKNISSGINLLKLELSSYEYLLNRKLLDEDKTYTDTSIDDIIADIFVDYNLDTNASKTISIAFKKKKKYLDILKDLANYGYDFKIENNTIIFKENVGIDRTSGENYLQFRFVKEDFDQSIAQISSEINADNFATAMYVGDNYYKDDNLINEFGKIETSETEGDETVFEDMKEIKQELEITPIIKNYFQVDIGDLVAVEVATGNKFLDYIGDLKILEKSYSQERTTIKLTKGKKTTPTLLEKIRNLDDRVYNLEI